MYHHRIEYTLAAALIVAFSSAAILCMYFLDVKKCNHCHCRCSLERRKETILRDFCQPTSSESIAEVASKWGQTRNWAVCNAKYLGQQICQENCVMAQHMSILLRDVELIRAGSLIEW